MKEIVFDVCQEEDGGYVAEALGESIFTQADTWEALRDRVREAVAAHFFDAVPPPRIRLHFIRDEILATG
jgi:predicted RNase H-like HicB family nuclease